MTDGSKKPGMVPDLYALAVIDTASALAGELELLKVPPQVSIIALLYTAIVQWHLSAQAGRDTPEDFQIGVRLAWDLWNATKPPGR